MGSLTMKISFICALILCCSLTIKSQDAVIDFKFETIEGKILNLESLNGEVVYLSFWATWCKPCIQNFEKYFDFRETLKSEGVVLLNINLDDDESKYKAFLEKTTTLNGINATPTNMAQVKADYKISSIPEYHIIDKAGSFVFLSQDPDRNVLAEFKKWLRE